MNGDLPRWEYTVLFGMDELAQTESEMVLNELGSQGWELTGIDTTTLGQARYVFKRPLVTSCLPEPEPELDPEQERWLRNTSTAEALMVLPEDRRDALLSAVLTDEERERLTPPDDFYERVERYLAEKREEA